MADQTKPPPPEPAPLLKQAHATQKIPKGELAALLEQSGEGPDEEAADDGAPDVTISGVADRGR